MRSNLDACRSGFAHPHVVDLYRLRGRLKKESSALPTVAQPASVSHATRLICLCMSLPSFAKAILVDSSSMTEAS